MTKVGDFNNLNSCRDHGPPRPIVAWSPLAVFNFDCKNLTGFFVNVFNKLRYFFLREYLQDHLVSVVRFDFIVFLI